MDGNTQRYRQWYHIMPYAILWWVHINTEVKRTCCKTTFILIDLFMHPLWDEIINTFNLSPPDQLYTAPNCIYQSLSNYSWPFETLKWFYKCFAVCSQLLCKVMHVFTSFFVVVEKQYFIFSLSCMRWLYTRIFADLMQFFTIYFRFLHDWRRMVILIYVSIS